MLTSTWSPVGLQAYLMFLVDPQGTDFGTVGASRTRPRDRFEAAELFTLPGPGHGWQAQLLELVRAIAG